MQGNRQNAQMAGLSWAQVSTPVGEVSAGWCGPSGIACVRFGSAPAGNDYQRELADAACVQLTEYFRGLRKAFDLPIDWSVTRRAPAPCARDARHVKSATGRQPATASSRGAAACGQRQLTRACPSRGQDHGIQSDSGDRAVSPVLASDGLGGYSGGTGTEVKRWLLILEGALPPTLDWQPAAATD